VPGSPAMPLYSGWKKVEFSSRAAATYQETKEAENVGEADS